MYVHVVPLMEGNANYVIHDTCLKGDTVWVKKIKNGEIISQLKHIEVKKNMWGRGFTEVLTMNP